ncbi:hypothetical protein L2E82_40671 [Cichorium intybus]|uniref:Uncharacterized protein n=1 Tax=Cichorium intybus TaxID=13427 RepID=A0ACB9AN00_CICIN|nr:hypothetical protein L2E82_40671 [Cichorium intybus]
MVTSVLPADIRKLLMMSRVLLNRNQITVRVLLDEGTISLLITHSLHYKYSARLSQKTNRLSRFVQYSLSLSLIFPTLI